MGEWRGGKRVRQTHSEKGRGRKSDERQRMTEKVTRETENDREERESVWERQ